MRPNIAHFLPWTGVGGTEQATLRIAEAISEDYSHVMFCRKDAPPVGDFFAQAGFETVAFEPITPSYRHAFDYWRASAALARTLKEREINLVHCADVAAAFTAALAGRIARIPVLCHVRNRHNGLRQREKRFLRFVNKFAFVSKDTWQRFGYRVRSGRGVVIYDGIDTDPPPPEFPDIRRELGLERDTKMICSVARVAPQKDFITLSRAAAAVVRNYPNVRFVVVGDHLNLSEHRDHYANVKQALDENGLASYFIFTGFRTDVASFLSNADLFVLCTHFEGLPLVILEAMSHGLPVVATAVDGIPEIIQDGKTGLLHRHEDANQLSDLLLALLNDEPLAARLGAAAHESVKSKWSRERFAADMSALYRSLLGSAVESSAALSTKDCYAD